MIEPRHRVALEVLLPLDVGDLLGVGRARFVCTGVRRSIRGRGVAQIRTFRRGQVGGHLELGGGLAVSALTGFGAFAEIVRRGVVPLGLGLVLAVRLLEDGVLLQFLLHEIHQLELIKLKQLDRLLQLGRHHQLLRHLQLLFQFDGHGRSGFPFSSCAWGAGRHARFIPIVLRVLFARSLEAKNPPDST